MADFLLKCNGLRKSFASPHGEIPVLRGVDFAVAEGESLAICGESGSGKSTLLALLAALDRPDAGELYWQGHSVCDQSAKWQARYRSTFIGMVFQAYYLIPELNALENVIMASRIAKTYNKEMQQRAVELLERVGLKERMRHLTNQLSGGECQRVAIARALLNRPPLILADEPTGNLDEATGKSVMELLLKLCREDRVGMVLVTHHQGFAASTDRLLHLKLGKFSD